MTRDESRWSRWVAQLTAPRSVESGRRSLDEIGLETGTDKSSAGHDLLAYYEPLFAPLRDESFTLLEIGVRDGASIRLWEQYFSAAAIIGYDFNARSREFASDRVRIVVADQKDTEQLAELARESSLKLVIDDGSHKWAHQIASFEAMYPYLPPGAIYIIEDIHTSFGEAAAATFGDEGPTAFTYLQSLSEGLIAGTSRVPVKNDFDGYFRRTARSVTFLGHAAIITKASFAQRVFRRQSVADVQPNAHHHLADPPYDRLPSRLVGPTARVERAWRNLHEDSPVLPIPATSATLRDVTVVGSGLALTSTGEILSETLNCAQNIRRSSDMYRPPYGADWANEKPLIPAEHFVARPGVRQVLLKQTWDANYGHWLIDALPKIGLLEEILPLDECEFIVNAPKSDAMRRVVLDSLALAGVREDQVRLLPPAVYWFEELTILGTVSRHPVYKAPRAIRFLERLAEGVVESGPARIYLSRNKYPRRQLVNEEAVIALLEGHDYTILYPEELSLAEQISAFRSADFVIGNMGAAFSSLAFSPQGVSVLALATESMPHDFFYDIVCHKDGRYRGLQGLATSAPPNMSSDFTIDLDLFAESLEWLHGGETP